MHVFFDALFQCISIHSLRMEGDGSGLADSLCKFVFQSTPSAWRETEPA